MKKALALFLAFVMTLALVACGGEKADSTPTDGTPTSSAPAGSSPAPSGTSTTPSTPAEPKILKLSLAETPANAWAPASNTAASVDIQGCLTGTLYRFFPIDGKATLAPVLAASEPVDVSGDGKTWNIAISPDAKWENGEKINADTFVYSMQKTLDPKLVFMNASIAAKNYITIANGVEYCTQGSGTSVTWEDVGFKKVDDLTVQVTTTAPVSAELVMLHFTSYVTGPVYEPLFEECLAADGLSSTYGSSKDTIISSGPFKLSAWVDGATYEFVKNENYVLADLIKLDGMTHTVLADAGTKMQMFEKGELDYITLDAAGVEKFGDDPNVSVVPGRRVYSIEYCSTNTEKPIINNENFRKALYYASNREELAKLRNHEPATGVVGRTSTATADGTTFRQLAKQAGYEPENNGYDVELAKKYFEKALQEEGLTSVEITLLSNNSSGTLTMCEYLQETWQNAFGADKFKLNIDAQPSGPAGELRRGWKNDPNSYEITITTWNLNTGDFDPIKALQPYTNTYSARNAPYEDELLNTLYAEAHKDENMLDMDKRNELALEMEKYIIEHAMVNPLTYEGTFCVFNERVIVPTDEYNISMGWGMGYVDIVE